MPETEPLFLSGDHFEIVILEDNEPDLVMIKRSIREAGLKCEFTAFADGAEAMMHVNGSTSPVPDLVILDLNTPKADGPSVLNSIRSSPRWTRVGVFMFTASRDPGDIARVRMLGADQCLTKPMDLAGFAKIGLAVREWLEHTQQEAGRRNSQAPESKS
jgi:CheY-like chemotaxis protein